MIQDGLGAFIYDIFEVKANILLQRMSLNSRNIPTPMLT
jgi:hypothetical protein